MGEREYLNGFVWGDEIVLVRRGEDGDRILDRFPARYTTHHRVEHLSDEIRRSLRNSASVKEIKFEGLSADRATGWCRISWLDYETRRHILGVDSPLRSGGAQIYEGDLSPVVRYCVDNAIKIARPKRIYLDIETDSRVPFSKKEQARVLCWSLVDEVGVLVESGMLAEFTDDGERTLLEDLWRSLMRFDQVVAWASKFGDTFDFEVIKARTKRLGIKVQPRILLWIDQLAAFARMNITSSESGDEKQSMKLQDVAMSILGEGKDDFDSSKTYEAWAAGGEERARLMRYNIQDTKLLPKIEAKTGYLELLQTIAEACGVFPDTRGLLPTVQVDGFLLRLARERGSHFGTKVVRDGEEETDTVPDQYAGAFVMEPNTNGIAQQVHVGDFASLYPSIIIAWNMSPETRIGINATAPVEAGRCREPKTRCEFHATTEGMLPEALIKILGLRKFWNDKKTSLPPGTPEWKEADRRSTAYKQVANSFYGVLGASTSRYYDRMLAEAITQAGVWLFRKTEGEAIKRGWRVIYGDTDSIFVVGCSSAEFREFVDWCNVHLYPRILAETGVAPERNRIKLAYEKEFRRLVFTSAKRYVGIFEHYKGKAANKDSKPEIKGLEYKRGDAARLARELQGRVIEQFRDEERWPEEDRYEAIVATMKARVLEGDLPLVDVAISKGLSKELKEYVAKKKLDGTDSAAPAHVRVARILLARGEEVRSGTRISYVVVDASGENQRVIPASDYDGTCDRYYVWEDLVWPPTQRLLAAMFPGVDWTPHDKVRPRKARARQEALEKAGQSTLFGSAAASAKPPKVDFRPKPGAQLPIVVGQFKKIDSLVLRIPEAKADKDTLEAIRRVFSSRPGRRPIEVVIALRDGTEVTLDVPTKIAADEETERTLLALVAA